MQKTVIKKIKTWSLIVVSVYLVSGIILYFLQENILFQPVALTDGYRFNFSVPFKEINVPVNKEKNLSIIYFLFR